MKKKYSTTPLLGVVAAFSFASLAAYANPNAQKTVSTTSTTTTTEANPTRMKNATNEAANLAVQNYVPGGKIIKAGKTEYKIQTPSGGVVEIDLNKKGELEEASGNSVENDVFAPGSGLVTLEAAAKTLKDTGKTPKGEWSLEKEKVNGWVYELESYVNNKKMEYKVSAKDGKLLSEKVD